MFASASCAWVFINTYSNLLHPKSPQYRAFRYCLGSRTGQERPHSLHPPPLPHIILSFSVSASHYLPRLLYSHASTFCPWFFLSTLLTNTTHGLPSSDCQDHWWIQAPVNSGSACTDTVQGKSIPQAYPFVFIPRGWSGPIIRLAYAKATWTLK